MVVFAQYRFDSDSLVLKKDQQVVVLRPKVAQLLQYLLARPQQVISREALLEALWQHGEYRDAALTQSMTELRQALGDDAQQPSFIRTIPQQGYQWICPLTQPKHSKHKVLLSALLSAALLIGGGVIALFTHTDPAPVSAQLAHPALTILPLDNQTGVAANAWWGYALHAALTTRLQSEYRLIPAAQSTKEDDSAQVALTLSRQQQRYVLTIHTARQQQKIVVEQLDMGFDNVAEQIITVLALLPDGQNARKSEQVASQDYYRGLQALDEQGNRLAKSYFEATLTQYPQHLAAQLELARIAWQQGELAKARALFAAMDLNAADPAIWVRHYLYLAEFYKALGDYAQAQTAVQHGLTLAQRHQLLEQLATAYQLQAELFWLTQQWDAYAKALNSAYALIGSRALAYRDAQQAFYLANPPAVGPETKRLLDLERSKQVLAQSIAFYRQSPRRNLLARALFAYGQNYLVPVAQSEPSLLEALDIASELGDDYLKKQILTYLGFYYIQLHQHDKAQAYLAQVEPDPQFIPHYELHWLLRGMAIMDGALNQDGAPGLATAIEIFEQLLGWEQVSTLTAAHAQLMLGWSLIKQDELVRADALVRSAQAVYQQLKLVETEGYARYTRMYIHLRRGEAKQALTLLSAPEQASHLELLYGAVAAFMVHDHALSKQLSDQLATRPNSAALINQLTWIRAAIVTPFELVTAVIDKPYSVYCQSNWAL
ncbi:winged helix-turn-helix domain-containing protein [Pseudoalteromonas sp. DL2-H2.2]|uniref:winged helix-turn-helix domain-containing protein n=1 Tax=Pseudoalteromonas sp. DL2-H2.2 TaxID=2908889 RepID=UPI001F1CBD3B|nr:winged helix-turn-helix domain-containing protein [Pseudoalteromonas sp. DL2-H2.2]MCF2911239.1 winged helix-turn-helix domain-containing protein [Pseudoalteromonas sp. DL2-H2.2]